MSECETCKGRRHVRVPETDRWKRCVCVGGEKAARAVEAHGATEAAPLMTWGKEFPRFVRKCWAGKEVFVVRADAANAEQIGMSVLSASEATDRKARMDRLSDIVDAQFDLKLKQKIMKPILGSDVMVIVCGSEVQTKMTDPVLTEVLGRRLANGRPTMIVCVGDPFAIYGKGARQTIGDDAPTFKVISDENR